MLSGGFTHGSGALRSYLAALALTLGAVWLRILLDPWIGDYMPFALLFATVALSVWIGGTGPGFLSAVLGLVLTDLLVIHPPGSLQLMARHTPGALLVSGIYMTICGVVMWLGYSMRTAQRKFELYQRELDCNATAQQLLLALHDATRDLSDPEDVIWQIVTQVGRHMNASRCLYGQINGAQDRVLIVRDYTDGVPSIAGSYELDAYGPRMIAELKAGHTVAIGDADTDPRTKDPAINAAFIAARSRAVVSVPLIKQGRYVAVLAVHQEQPRLWSADEIRLLEQVAERSWFAVENARANADLRESRSVLTLAMRSGRMGAWSYNTLSERLTLSPELEEILGLKPRGNEYAVAEIDPLVHPDDAPAVSQCFLQALSTGADFRAEFRVRSASGEWRWMESNARATLGSAGRPIMYHGVCADITQYRLSIDTQREASRRKDEFLATLAHELRNPLSPIRNAVEILRRHTPDDPTLKSAHEVIDRQVLHLTRLVDDLLDVARYTHGKIRLQKIAMSLGDALRDAVDATRPLFEQAGQHLEIDTTAEALHISGDPTRVGQVIHNLLNNASKYTARGGRIRVQLKREARFAVLSVRDDGIGIAGDHLQHLFEMFSQAPAADGQVPEGLGIGLALVRAFVEMHGGSVEAKSAGLGLGSEFIVRLPIRELVPEVQPSPAPPATVVRPLRVLLVDDNRDALETLACLLKLSGHEVHLAHDGPEAVARATELQPDAMLLDLGLPGMSGIEVAHQIRRQPWGADITLIALTGWGQEQDKQKTAGARFDHHLTKPADLASVEAALAKRRPEMHAQPAPIS